MAAATWRFYFRFCFFCDFAQLGRLKSTCIPNFANISQSTVEILLLPVSWNKRPVRRAGILFPVSIFIFALLSVAITITVCISLPNFIQIGPSTAELWRHIDFSQWRSRRGNSTSGFVMRIWECRNLPAYQILARYLSPQLRYYYFRFLKTNVRHAGILLPIPIFTFAWPSTCHSASAYQLSSKSDRLRSSYSYSSRAVMTS